MAAPRWVHPQDRRYWDRPWTCPTDTRKATRFKKRLRNHGFLSPNFRIAEARCHDPAQTGVPERLLPRAQRHAFNLERLRHELGDRPLSILSWYRTPFWNRHVGGVEDSRHKRADATDFTVQQVDRFGARRFDTACERVFRQGGFGRYSTGARHVDSRGTRARW